MTQVFVPPVVSQVPRVLADSEGPQFALMRYYPAHGEGQNVYVYADGTVTLAQPVHTTAELSADAAPLYTYYGGHVHVITDAEAAVLSAAGFTTTPYSPSTPTSPVLSGIPGGADQSGLMGGSYGTVGYGYDRYGGPVR